tara:strand:- start:135 stop:437 length:303 start_codon:yes stop_codon:yes gene_type:complete
MSDLDANWEYRVVRRRNSEGENFYSVQEVYFDDDDNQLAQSTDLQVEGETLPQMRKQLQRMIWALDKEVVEEMEDKSDEVFEQSKTKVIGTIEVPENYWE